MTQDTKSKKEKVLKGNKRNLPGYVFIIPALILVIGVTLIIYLKKGSREDVNFGNTFVRYESVKAENGIVTIPASIFDDYEAKYFTYNFPEEDLFFFAVKSRDGIIRAAFDACDVCFGARKGYRQQNEVMICNNCGQVFPTNRINIEKGGCNPAPLNREVINGELVIRVDDLYEGMRYFTTG